MPQLIVRQIKAQVVKRLKQQAAAHGFSMEEEHRRILRESLLGKAAKKPSFKDALFGMPNVGEEFFVSVLVLGETRQGIERIRPRAPEQARALEKWLLWIAPEFHDRVLPVDSRVADQWGRLGVQQPVPVLDAYQAATPLVHGLRGDSRDEPGFRGTGVTVINPFSKTKPKAG